MPLEDPERLKQDLVMFGERKFNQGIQAVIDLVASKPEVAPEVMKIIAERWPGLQQKGH